MDFNATSLSRYDFSTFCTTLPHILINDKLINLIKRIFHREGSHYLACYDIKSFFTPEQPKNIMHGLVNPGGGGGGYSDIFIHT